MTSALRAELEALLVLRGLPGVGDRTLSRALREGGSPAAGLAAPGRRFERWAGRRACSVRRERGRRAEAVKAADRILGLGVRALWVGGTDYPTRLQDLHDPPPLLFLRGAEHRIPDRGVVAVVGSRSATPYGLRVAQAFARSWSRQGVTVISGLALGVDAAAHEGALAGGGMTGAVLGSGVDRPSPARNRRIADRIRARGFLLSEFLPGVEAQPFHFPRRNRIMAALADAVVVVEAGQRSGALITVDHALDLGRQVFAVPGPVDRPQSRGTNLMIQDGAAPLLRPDDLIREMGWMRSDDSPTPATTEADRGDGLLQSVLAEVTRAAAEPDAIARRAGVRVDAVLATLGRLELEGAVGRGPDGLWRAVEGGW
jgi:DNA processing protein